MNKTLQIGLTAYYNGELYDEETGTLIPENVSKLGLTLGEIDLCMQWLEAYNDYNATYSNRIHDYNHCYNVYASRLHQNRYK